MADRPSEFALIAQVFAPLASTPGALGLTDDVALLPARANCDFVVTADALVEGVHFFADDPAAAIAKKALRVNLSDLAAKGAEPAGYLLALSLPSRLTMEWIEEFARGLAQDQQEFGIALLGGDTTTTPGPLTLSITAIGYVPAGELIRRAGAKEGDGVFVSGTLGDAGGGLELLQRGGADVNGCDAGKLIQRYRLPSPRLTLGRALRGVATAALDVSDGFIADLAHIADASGMRIVIEAACIPRSPALRALWGDGRSAVVHAATAGDDYEIAFTGASEAKVLEAARRSGVPVTRVGRVERGAGVALVDADGREIAVPKAGFTHF